MTTEPLITSFPHYPGLTEDEFDNILMALNSTSVQWTENGKAAKERGDEGTAKICADVSWDFAKLWAKLYRMQKKSHSEGLQTDTVDTI